MNHQIGSLRKFSAHNIIVYSYDAQSGKIIEEKYVTSEKRLFICLGFITIKYDDPSIDNGPDNLMLILSHDGIKWIQPPCAGVNSFYD